MSRSARLTTAGVSVLVSISAIALVTGAFTPQEKTTIQALRQRITALETLTATQASTIASIDEAIAGIENDLGTINDNQVILSNDIDILDAGLSGLVADDGPLAQIDRNLKATQDIVFAAHPQITITDVVTSSTCTTTCTAVVEWNVEPPATGQVEWGLTDDYGSFTAKENDLLGFHRQSISGLAPETTYHFRILADIPETGATGSLELTAAVG